MIQKNTLEAAIRYCEQFIAEAQRYPSFRLDTLTVQQEGTVVWSSDGD